MKISFKGCKYLDYQNGYKPGCKLQILGNGQLFWFRKHITTGDSAMVQFCQKRGRLNGPERCLSENKAVCSDYIEHEHCIEVSEEELDG